MKTYFRVIKDCIKLAPVSALLMLIFYCLGFVELASPIITSRLIGGAQDFLNGGSADIIWNNLVIMCIVLLISAISLMAAAFMDLILKQKLSRGFEQKLFKKMCSIPQILLENSKYFEKYTLASNAVEINNDMNSMSGIIYVSLSFLDSIVTVVVNIVILVSFSPKLLLFAVLSTPLSMAISVFSENMQKKLRRAQAQKTRETEYFWGLFCKKESVKEMRVLGASSFFRTKWFNKRDEMLNEEMTVHARLLKIRHGGEVVKNLFYGLNIALAIALVIRGEISIGEFTACIGVFASLQGTLVAFMYNIEYFFERVHMSEDYYAFMDLEERGDGTKEFGVFNDKIELKNVSFRYPNMTDYALKNINLEINKGERIVIVGENGSGKTTLSKLITACYPPEKGSIMIDKINTADLKKSSYLNNFSVVSQNFIKYNMTLRENIAISDTAHIEDTERVNNVIALSGLKDTAEIIGGTEVQLGREFGGFELSGGQWQKTAIARGLFRNAPIILLDEPTAALDPLVEYEILNDFVNITRDKTSVIISHRIGICTAADRIIVMKDGTVAEQGTHSNLLKKNGEYTRMWNAQAQWFSN